MLYNKSFYQLTWWNLYKSFDFWKNLSWISSFAKASKNSSSEIKLGIRQHLNGDVRMTDPFSIEKERKGKNDSLNNECHTKAF